MARSILSLFLWLAVATAGISFAKKFNETDPVTTEEVEATLSFELGSGASASRIKSHEEALRMTFAVLPKNANGNLGHQAVRYVLHRYFVQRSGWYITGLEPTNDTWYTNTSAKNLIGSVPSFIQGRLEKHLGSHGLDLHGLATLAMVIEDLIHKEAVTQLEEVYKALRLPRWDNISIIDVQEAIDTYMMIHLVSRKVTVSSPHEAAFKRDKFAEKYKNFSDVHAWVQKIERPHLIDSRVSEFGLNFPEVSRMVEELGEQFGVFNDYECHELKSTLLGMEFRKEGRVRLSDFYNKSFLSHWRFTEKAEYLRDLGALDESDPSQPLVIISNYLSARPNCLEATALYAVCCRNECEDLFGHLEQEIGGSTAFPHQIARLVANLTSDTVTAPRVLSKSLLLRLDEVAAAASTNGKGLAKVNLHGRLFAQWMHHAFPRECPYPHEAGSTNPQSADEWIKTSGHESEQASEEEMKKVIEDACPTSGCESGGGKQEDYELPWSVKEELLVTVALRPQAYEQPSFSLSFVALIAVWLFLAGLLVARIWKVMTVAQKHKLGIVLLICWFTWACIFAHILDAIIFICPVVGGLMMLWIFRRGKFAAKTKQCDV